MQKGVYICDGEGKTEFSEGRKDSKQQKKPQALTGRKINPPLWASCGLVKNPIKQNVAHGFRMCHFMDKRLCSASAWRAAPRALGPAGFSWDHARKTVRSSLGPDEQLAAEVKRVFLRFSQSGWFVWLSSGPRSLALAPACAPYSGP